MYGKRGLYILLDGVNRIRWHSRIVDGYALVGLGVSEHVAMMQSSITCPLSIEAMRSLSTIKRRHGVPRIDGGMIEQSLSSIRHLRPMPNFLRQIQECGQLCDVKWSRVLSVCYWRLREGRQKSWCPPHRQSYSTCNRMWYHSIRR